MSMSPTKADGSVVQDAQTEATTGPSRQGSMVEDDFAVKFWMPALFGLQDVIMASEIEVRTRALQYMFEALKQHGGTFKREFWELLAKGVLFPIFEDLKFSGTTTSLANSKFTSKEEMLVWLSTTLIQALRQLVDLFTFYFDNLQFILEGMLDVLQTCLMHENEALSRIGSTCLQQLVEHNVNKLNREQWSLVVTLLEQLADQTTPYFLFFDLPNAPTDSDFKPANLDNDLEFLKSNFGPPPEKKAFQRLISKCVVHLLIIQTIDDILRTGPNDIVYN
eukprot:jgi/Hompol1/4082/HPOL_006912-RA